MLNLRPMDKTETADFLSSGEPETFEYLKANISESFDNSTLGLISDNVKEALNSDFDEKSRESISSRTGIPLYDKEITAKTFTAGEWKESPYYREGVEFKDGWSESRAKYLAESYDERKVREQTINIGRESDKTLWGSGLAGQMIGGLPDPINLIPFGGAASKSAKIGEKLIRGAIEGAAGNLAVSSMSRPYYESRGIDSDWQDYVNDVFIGGFMGGGFAGGGHAVSIRKGARLKERATMGKAADVATEAIRAGDELDLASKVEGMNEALREMRAIPEVMKTERVESEVLKLQDLGFSREEASASITPMAAHIELISSYTGKTFDESWDEFGATFQAAEIKDGKIVASESIAAAREMDAWVDSELHGMWKDLENAQKGGERLFIDGEFKGTMGDGSYPAWYADLGLENKEHFKKVIDAKRGPVYERLKKLAEERLENGSERGGPEQEFIEAKKKVPVGGESFNKKSKNKDRGAITFDKDGKSIISLFKDADRSTIVHESGHLFLNNLERLSKMEGMPDGLRKDFEAIKSWLGVKGEKIETKHHEKFARGFEQFLREGKAPRSDLQGVFEKFSNWLKSVYKRAEDLKVKLSPEAREVYGRLLGAEKEVDLNPTRAPEAPAQRFESEADLDSAVNEIEKAIIEARESGASPEDLQVLRDAMEEMSAQERAIDEAFTLFQSGKTDAEARAQAARAAGVNTRTMDEIIDAFNEKLLRESGESMSAAEAASQLKAALAAEMKEQKRQASLSLMARQEVASHVKVILDAGGSPRQAILSILEGDSTLRGVKGGGRSVDGHYMALAQSTSARCFADLRKIDPKIDKLFENDVQFNQNVIKEMIKPGSSGDEVASAAAKVFTQYGHAHVDRANLAGARIGKLEGWVPRTHDADKMIGNRSEWIKFMKENLDPERSLKGLNDAGKDEVLEEIFASFITDNHGSTVGIDADAPLMRPPRNIAKKMGEHRSLHFKSPESELEYLRRFGQGENVLQTMSTHLERMSRSIALMERLGPNPESTIADAIQKMHDKIKLDVKEGRITDTQADEMLNGKRIFKDGKTRKTGGLGSVQDLKSRNSAIGHALGMALGENDSTQGMFKSFSRTMRAINSLSKLGSALLSQPTDFVHALNERRIVSSNNEASAWVELFSDYFKRATPEMKEVLEHTGIYIDAMNVNNFNRFEADNINGRLARWNDKMFRYSGQDWHVRSSKKAAAISLTRELGSNISKSWDKMHPGLREALVQYGGFTKDKWDIIRKVDPEIIDGKAYYHPGLLQKLDDSVFESMIPDEFKVTSETMPGVESGKSAEWEAGRAKEITRARQKLEMDLKTFFVEEGRNAAPEPDAKVRRIMSFGAKQGTNTHEAMKLLAQFKTFAFVNYDRSIKGKRMMRNSSDYGGLVHHAAATLALGYMSTVLKDLAKGVTPADPSEGKTWGRAALQSGGLGIMGDFLGSAYSARSGSDVLATIAGPTISTLSEASVLALKMAHGETYEDGSKYASKWVGLAKGVTPAPFSTLWYTRAAMDYLVWSRLKEELEPGSIRRSERRLKKEFNQKYIYRP